MTVQRNPIYGGRTEAGGVWVVIVALHAAGALIIWRSLSPAAFNETELQPAP